MGQLELSYHPGKTNLSLLLLNVFIHKHKLQTSVKIILSNIFKKVERDLYPYHPNIRILTLINV